MDQKADPNKGEYREMVWTLEDTTPLPSIGALLFDNNLELLPSGTEYKFVKSASYELDTLDEFMGKIINYQRKMRGDQILPKDKLPHISKGYKFQACVCLANATCFYLGDGLIATAGHCVFENHTETLKNKLLNMKVVFGLKSFDINLGKVATNRVFSIQRALFGQDVPFFNITTNLSTVDRADWAILKLQPHTDPQATLPKALPVRPLAPQQRIDRAWLAGHPWGIGLTLAQPKDNSGYCIVNGSNSVQHNLLTAPANSGGPILNDYQEVVALVASGRGDEVVNRGFFYLEGPEIIPLPILKVFGGTQINIFSCLFQKRGTFFLACQLPVVPPPAAPGASNTITVKVLHGDGDDSANWQSFDLVVNQAAPGNNILQLTTKFAPLAGTNDRPWQFNIRALAFTYSYPDAAPGGGGGGGRGRRGGAPVVVPKITNLIFGCYAEGEKASLQNWTVLYKGDGPVVLPGKEDITVLQVFLGQDWKQVDSTGHMGLFDTTI